MVLIVPMFAGAAIRQFFVLRHGYKLGRNRHPLAYALVGVAAIVSTTVWMAQKPVATESIAARPIKSLATASFDYEKLQPVLAQRCYLCHSE